MDDEEAPQPEGGDRWAAILRAQDVQAVHKHWRRGLLLVGLQVLTAVAVAAGFDHAGPGVEVVESGFARTGTDIGFGAIVENTTDRIAYHTVACARLPGTEDGGCDYEFTIEVLLPGQRVGFGSTGSDFGGASTGLDVEVRGPAQWLDPEEESYGEIVTSDLLLAYSPEDEPVVSFVATLSEGGVKVRTATAYAIFRDADGDIVGGAGVDIDTPLRYQQEVRQTVDHRGKVPDLASAEVYVFPSGV